MRYTYAALVMFIAGLAIAGSFSTLASTPVVITPASTGSVVIDPVAPPPFTAVPDVSQEEFMPPQANVRVLRVDREDLQGVIVQPEVGGKPIGVYFSVGDGGSIFVWGIGLVVRPVGKHALELAAVAPEEGEE